LQEDGKHFEQTFDSIFIVSPEAEQPLFQLLRRQYSSDILTFCSINTMPTMEQVKDKGRNSLIIFDDMMLEKKQTPFEEFYIKGRHCGWSVMYLAQTYFEAEKNIRVNANIVAMLHGGGTNRNIGDMVADCCLGVSKEEAMMMYSTATEKKFQPFVVMKDNPLQERFRDGLFDVFAIPPPISIAPFSLPTTTASTKKSSEKKTSARRTSAQTSSVSIPFESPSPKHLAPPYSTQSGDSHLLNTPVQAVESLLEPFKCDGQLELTPCTGNNKIASFLRKHGYKVITRKGSIAEQKIAVLVYSLDDESNNNQDDICLDDEELDDDSDMEDLAEAFDRNVSVGKQTL